MIYSNTIPKDQYGVRGACRPWDSLGAGECREGSGFHVRQDPPEQQGRCMTCPHEECRDDQKCSYRLYGRAKPVKLEQRPTKGYERDKPLERRPPKGYDRDKLDAAWTLEYTYKGLGKRLGITPRMAKRWLEWREQHG